MTIWYSLGRLHLAANRERHGELPRNGCIKKFYRNESGVGVVEFAILVPVVLAILFAIIEFGSIMYTRQQMLYAAREAARSYAVGQSTIGEAKEVAYKRLEIDTSVVAADDIKFTVIVTGPGADAGDVNVKITIPMAAAAVINPLGEVISGTLEVNVVMRMERPAKAES